MENSHQASNKKDISKFEVYLYLLSDFIKWRQYGGINEKIEVLRKIAHQFNEEEVIWALGASMLLYFKGITS